MCYYLTKITFGWGKAMRKNSIGNIINNIIFGVIFFIIWKNFEEYSAFELMLIFYYKFDIELNDELATVMETGIDLLLILGIIFIVFGVIGLIKYTSENKEPPKRPAPMQSEPTRPKVFCSNCCSYSDATARFCQCCGVDLYSQNAAQKQEPTVCTQCGKSLIANSRFCQYCGSNLRR